MNSQNYVVSIKVITKSKTSIKIIEETPQPVPSSE